MALFFELELFAYLPRRFPAQYSVNEGDILVTHTQYMRDISRPLTQAISHAIGKCGTRSQMDL